jgi:hypothetical protein
MKETQMFIAAKGLNYLTFLDTLHARMTFDFYLEVGSQTGRSLEKSRSKSIAVDPRFQLKTNAMGNKPQLHLFQCKSDDFFASGFLKALNTRLSLSFLDGMHLFEYLLRDFMHAEANSHPDGVILLHDCCPFSHAMTTRDIDNLPKGAWTGDVWKLLPILQHYRPDLIIEVLDCAPTGLVLIRNLAPGNTVLTDHYDAIIDHYTAIDLETYGTERFFSSFTFSSADAVVAAGFPQFAKVRQTEAARENPRLRQRTHHGVTLHSCHPILHDFAADLGQCIASPVGAEVDVFVGVHQFGVKLPGHALRIGIQTEQFADHDGKALWRAEDPQRIAAFVAQYDLLLDLNADNAPAYAFLPPDDRAKVHFGPHIFPVQAPKLASGTGPALFFGAMNARRKAVLGPMIENGLVTVAPPGTFGAELDAMIMAAGSVANVHFQEGVYSEYPRFLKSYLRGKPILSERLAPPLIMDKHYFDLRTKISASKARAALAQVGKTMSADFTFQRFLETACRSLQTRPKAQISAK